MKMHLVYHKNGSQVRDSRWLGTRSSELTAQRAYSCFVSILLALLFGTTACSTAQSGGPTVVIVSPPNGSEFREGDEIAVQSTATDSAGIARVELVVDNVVVRNQSITTTRSVVMAAHTWRATQGVHVILVRAYNTAGQASNPAAVAVTVQSVAPTLTLPTSTLVIANPTPLPAVTPTVTVTACTDNVAFVADVTVPDGTLLASGQTFNKIWRVRNTGCPWGEGYELVFVSGEAMSATLAFPLPQTESTQTADLLVAMTAPTAPGSHFSNWRFRNPSGQFFGTNVIVVITVIGSSGTTTTTVPPSGPTGCSGVPNISSFTATQRIIPVFGSTTLTWGPVTNADRVEIDQGIGAVGSPGTVTVAPTGTTTYTLTAYCGSQTATAQTRVVLPFAILATVAGIDTNDYTGPCPKTMTLSATITANDAGTVTYKWESSDGSLNGAVLNLSFDGPDAKTVTRTWTLGVSGHTYPNYWVHVHTLSPTDVTSNNAGFTLKCN